MIPFTLYQALDERTRSRNPRSRIRLNIAFPMVVVSTSTTDVYSRSRLCTFLCDRYDKDAYILGWGVNNVSTPDHSAMLRLATYLLGPSCLLTFQSLENVITRFSSLPVEIIQTRYYLVSQHCLLRCDTCNSLINHLWLDKGSCSLSDATC